VCSRYGGWLGHIRALLSCCRSHPHSFALASLGAAHREVKTFTRPLRSSRVGKGDVEARGQVRQPQLGRFRVIMPLSTVWLKSISSVIVRLSLLSKKWDGRPHPRRHQRAQSGITRERDAEMRAQSFRKDHCVGLSALESERHCASATHRKERFECAGCCAVQFT
jgi:hypothetical protein